jgi:Periplasmic protease
MPVSGVAPAAAQLPDAARAQTKTHEGSGSSLVPRPAISALVRHAPPVKTLMSTQDAEEMEAVYDEVWRLISDHFLYQERLVNWSQWRHRFDGKMKTRKDAEKAINTMIESLGDEYTFFRNRTATHRRHCQGEERNVVTSSILPGNIGYLRIDTFNSTNTMTETRAALASMSNAQGYILDLRDNAGGCIDTAFGVFAMLANSGKFVTMRGTSELDKVGEELVLDRDAAITIGNGKEQRSSRERNLTGVKPLTVLVNDGTKSAAEMLTGALRDNDRAVVVGEKTFGKGIVQRVWEFPDNTSIKISSARFYLPHGDFIHECGLEPDLVVNGKRLARLASNPDSLKFTKKAGMCICKSHGNKLPGHDRQLDGAYNVVRERLISMAK